MSQQGEIPAESAVLRAAPVQPPPPGIQVQAPPQLQSQPQPQPDASSAKRRREEGDGAAAGETGESAPKRQAKVQDVIFRIVVPSRQIGKVIGKAGHRIQKIREATRATIKIADAIARHEERVIIISSKDNEEMVSDAENALQQIAALILTEDDIPAMAPPVGIVGAVGAFAALGTVGPFGAVGAPGTTGTIGATGAVGAGHVAANTIRLLIAGSQAGSLIGMSGQNIEKLRSSSGATITILAPNQLPLCASAHDSDRVVQLSGDVPAVLKALTEIGHQLRENPPKQVISISPAYNYSLIRPAQPYVDPTSADYVTFTMMISETMVGGLIGRCGSNISRIRNESGAMIKVYGGKGEQKHRHIQFGGSAQQVALAKQRVDEYIYSQLIQEASAQQQGYNVGTL